MQIQIQISSESCCYMFSHKSLFIVSNQGIRGWCSGNLPVGEFLLTETSQTIGGHFRRRPVHVLLV
jgi:hypothetical protein